MNTIRLKCHTLGRGFGEVLKVGNKDGEISKKDAEALVGEGHAEVLEDIVVTSSKELKRDLEATKSENVKLKSELAALQDENMELTAEMVHIGVEAEIALSAANDQVEDLKVKLEAATAGSKSKANGKS